MSTIVHAVVGKEFREYRRNKLVLFTMIGMPITFLAIIVVSTFAIPASAPPQLVDVAVGQALLFFLLVPVVLPTVIAGYTVIGEREQGTLEPVLTTPATDREILLGKAIAATVPSVLLSWSLYALYAVFAALFAHDLVIDQVLTAAQVVAQLVLAPALALFAILVGMLISVRSTDVRAAQQLSGLAVLPVFGLLSLVSFGVVEATVVAYLAASVVVGVVDLVAWGLAVRLFDRERLLTRYGAG